MSHNLTIHSDGGATFAATGDRQEFWHRLGQDNMPEGVTVREALTHARLDNLDVHLEPLTYQVPQANVNGYDEPKIVTAANSFVVVRWDRETAQYVALPASVKPGDEQPAIVTNQFNLFTPEDFADYCDVLAGPMTDEGAFVSTAGAYGNYSVLFVCFDLQPLEIAGDTHGRYLGVVQALNGTMSVTGVRTMTRFVCMNTVTYGTKNATATFKCRHTANLHNRLDEARRALHVSHVYDDAMAKQLEALDLVKMTKDDVKVMVETIWTQGDTETDRQKNALENAVQDIVALSFHSDTTDGHHGTAYGVLQGATEFGEHFAPRRPRDEGARAWSTLTGGIADRSQRVFDYLSEFAGV